MAFRKGGNKLAHKTNNINNDIDKNILNAYKKSEGILNGNLSFTEKIPCLINVWKQARFYSTEAQKNYVIQLMDWLKRHTLNIILTGDWKKYKEVYEEVLISEVAQCESDFKKYNPNFSLKCKKLAEIIRDPWGNKILHKLLNCSEITVTQEELEFFAIETGYIISMRLKMLCESHCEDLALNLATTCLQSYRVAEEQNFNINATVDQKRFILDTYIALLYKFKNTSNIIEILKTLPLQQGLDLVRRFSNKRVSISKIWRYSKKITHLAAQVYITAAVLKPPEESLEILKQLLIVWLSLDIINEESVTLAVRRILQAADSAVHMYIFCELIYNKFQVKMKTFTIELFIRALTTDMNDLERQKNEENGVKVSEITNRLASGFLRLADVLDEHLKVSRECVLTAFSLEPSELTMQRIIKLAKRSGYQVLDTGQRWKCKLHPPAKESDEILWRCSECGENTSHIEFPSTLNTDTALSDALIAEELGLSSQLCDDLAVVIAGPRYQFLSWRLQWTELNNLCILYLNDPDRTKTLVKELKFVQIDYSMFSHIKKEPEDDELAGIEKGYEMYLQEDDDDEIGSSEDSTSLDSRFNGLGSDGTGESPIRVLPFNTPSTSKQSDPKVLKSLRMFRPNLKRTKENPNSNTSDAAAGKVYVGSSSTSSMDDNMIELPKVRTISSKLFNDTNSFECLSNPIFKERNYSANVNVHNVPGDEPCKTLTMNCGDEQSSFFNVGSNNFKIHLPPLFSPANNNKDKIEENKRLTSPLLELEQPSRKRSRTFSQLNSTQTTNKQPNSNYNGVNFLGKTKPVSGLTNTFTHPLDLIRNLPTKTSPLTLEQEISKLPNKQNLTSPHDDKDCLKNLEESCDIRVAGNLETFCSKHCKYIKIDKSTDENNLNQRCLLSNFPLKDVKVVLDRVVLHNSKPSSSSTYTRRKITKLQEHSRHENVDSEKLFGLKKSSCQSSTTVVLQRITQSTDCTDSSATLNKKTDESNTDIRKCSKLAPEVPKVSKNLSTPPEVGLKKNWADPPNMAVEGFDKDDNEQVERKENIENITQNISEDKIVHNKRDSLVGDKFKKATNENQKPKTFGNSYENSNNATKGSTGHDVVVLIKKEENRKSGEFKNTINPLDCSNRTKSVVDISKNDKPPMSLSSVYKKYTKKEHRGVRGDKLTKSQVEQDDKSSNNRYSSLLKHLKERVAILVDRYSNKENEQSPNFKIVENDSSQTEFQFKTEDNKETAEHKTVASPRSRSKSFCQEKIFPRIKVKRPNSVCGEEPSYSDKFTTNGPIDLKTNFDISAAKELTKLSNNFESYNPGKSWKLDLESNPQFEEPMCDNYSNDLDYDDLKMEDLIRFNPKPPTNSEESSKDVLKEFQENSPIKDDTKDPTKTRFDLQKRLESGLSVLKRKSNISEDDGTGAGAGAENRKKIKKQSSSEDLNKNISSVLSSIPGLNDLEMIQPQYTNSLVQVVQVSDPNISTAPTQNSITSTQVTPHIQRVGQPRNNDNKPDNNNSNAPVNSSTVITSSPPKSSVTEANSNIINILQNQVRATNSNQIVRPVQLSPVLRPAGIITTHPIQRSRAPPVINILSQQIIRPATIVSCQPRTTPTNNNEIQTNEVVHQAVSNCGEDVGQVTASGRLTSSSAVKTATILGTSTEQSRIVQFICKSSDGKIIPVTSLTPNKIVKVAVTQPVSSTASSNDSNLNNNSTLDNNFTKLIQPLKTNCDTTETSEALPKFQQAFGKSYQGNIEAVHHILTTTDNENNNNNNGNDESKSDKHTLLDTEKVVANKSHVKTTLLPNLQNVQGSVIYSHQGLSQTINLIPPGKGQVIRIATSSNPDLVKDSIIHNKMSALLAAALQGRQQQQQQQQQQQSNINSNATEADSSSEDSLSQSPTTIKITPQQRQTLVSNARIVKPVVHVSSNVIRSASNAPSNLSSTTLEQLREFDMVYKQVKERSNTGGVSELTVQNENNESSPPQISVTYLNQNQKLTCAPVVVVSSYCTVQSAVSPALSVSSQGSSSPCVTPSPSSNFKTNSKSSKSKTIKTVTTHTSKASPIPKPQQKPQEDEHTAQRIFDILAEYAEQLRNSPDLNNKPAPRRRSNPPTNPNQNAKRKKNSGTKKVSVQGNSSSSIITSDTEVDDSRTVGSEDSSCGVVHIALQDEEQSSAATAVSSENTETTTSPTTRNLILADSSVGEAFKMSNTAVLMPGNYIMPVSMVKGGQQIRVVSSGNSKILAAVPNRSGHNMLLFQSFLNQSRKTTNISSVKYSAVQPVATVPSQVQSSVILPSTTQNLASFTLGQSVTIKKSNEVTTERAEVNNLNGEFLLAISHPRENIQNNTIENPVTDAERTIINNNAAKEEDTPSEISHVTSLTTSTVSKTNSNLTTTTHPEIKRIDVDKGMKRKERIQSVLVAPGSINSPMLCQNTPNYTKHSQTANVSVSSTKEDFISSDRKVKEGKQVGGIQAYQYKNKKSQSGVQHLDRELHQLSLQRKQAALERELRLQKSLSEECEDLGVDEPSTSELFPEADIYFDSNHSPPFDQSSQDIKKTTTNQSPHTHIQSTTTKNDSKSIAATTTTTLNLFEDDDNSNSFRSDFLFDDPVSYQSTEMELEYDRSHGLTNGQKNICNKKQQQLLNDNSPLLENCGDTSVLSPVIPESCDDSHVLPINKCKYKYSNRRKGGDRLIKGGTESWTGENPITDNVTSKMIELSKGCSRESPPVGHDDEHDNILTKTTTRDQDDYVEVCSEEDEEVGGCGGSVSGRGARRSVKKLCSCCNGPQDGGNSLLRKRPASRPHTPALNKKSLVNKKR